MGDDGPATALNFNVFQLVVLSIVIGIASVRAGKAGSAFTGLVHSVLAITRIVLGWVLRLTPIGKLGLFGSAVARYGWDMLASLGWFAGSVYLGLGLVGSALNELYLPCACNSPLTSENSLLIFSIGFGAAFTNDTKDKSRA